MGLSWNILYTVKTVTLNFVKIVKRSLKKVTGVTVFEC